MSATRFMPAGWPTWSTAPATSSVGTSIAQKPATASASGKVCTAFTAAFTVSGGVREAHWRTRSTSGPLEVGPSIESTTMRLAVTASVPGGGGAVRLRTNSSCSSLVRLPK